MYYPQKFKGISLDKILIEVKKEGFDPIPITNSSGFVYSMHSHPETKLLVFLRGSMDVTVKGKVFHCLPGDKLIIPGKTLHKAVVGKTGCAFLWAEKIIRY